jgi:hypothetical protein
MSRPIQLHADLSIDLAREAEAIHYFETVYRPTASRFEGYIDLRLLKLHGALAGSPPGRHQLPVLDHLHQRNAASEVGRVGAAPGSMGKARDLCHDTRVRLLAVRNDLAGRRTGLPMVRISDLRVRTA